jgi:hypothetical protein
MSLDLKGILKSGIIWGLVGVALIILVHLLGRVLPAGVQGLTLATFAVMFAGVQFAASEKGGILVSLIGGALSGLVATLLLLALSFILPGTGISMGGGLRGLIPPLIAGVAGAIGMEIVRRVGRTTI